MTSDTPKPYWDRFEFVCDVLKSPSSEIVQEGYDLLFKLWLDYSSDTNFVEEIKLTAAKYLDLTCELIKRVDNLSDSAEEKAKLLKSIKSLLPVAPIKIFISYSHNDEAFKDELVAMVAGLEYRGIICAWHDRRIEPGTDWLAAIKAAMEECGIAVLFISPDFIASRFIQEVELKQLFQRRIKEGLRVVPIIVRPCLWQDEPVIKDLQALPKDGKPVISFSKDNGDRDQVWVDICKTIEMIAAGL
jgi:hypothetical protein